MKKTIAFYHPAFPGGGAERITLDIIKYLKGHAPEYEVFVMAKQINSSFLSPEIHSLVQIIKLPDIGEPDSEVEAVVSRTIQERKCSIVVEVGDHLPGIKNIAERNGCKIIFAHHSNPLWESRLFIDEQRRACSRSIKRKLEWILFRRFKYEVLGKARKKAAAVCLAQYNDVDAYTVLCEEYRQTFIKHLHLNGKNKIAVMNNPEYEVSRISLDKDKTILFVGRLSYSDKRVDRLLRIWKTVQDKLPDYKLLIVGDGPERKNLEDMAGKLELKRISFEGYSTDTGKYYRHASVSCLTSSTEGWPLCLTEAQAHGVIPVAFSCSGGVREILQPSGKNGFLVKPFREKEFARTIVKIARMDDREKLQIRQNAINKSRTYSIETIGEKWLGLFESLINH